ncbi:MAG: tRNA dihydrouridine synthase DusB [Clostridiales bacterium]|nr:tRNA dihydrouridine synthase DusB [Clostridiales bacterium]
MFKIGSVELENPFVLAPLAGITDAVMRTLCEQQGAAMTCTEMISAKGIYYGDKKTIKLAYIPEGAKPTAIQIFGSEPEIMAYAARKLDSLTNAVIDINMGCPVPKVVKNGDGSALLSNTKLVYEVTKAVVENSSKPVTVKIRKGFDNRNVNAVENALAIEEAGAKAITVHGRTRDQYYSGKADWDIITDVKSAVSIPVIGNGDVFSFQDGIKILDETGCDAVMVARGAMGNPWIFRELIAAYRGDNPLPQPTKEEKISMMTNHLDMLCKLKGEKIAVKEFRKFVVWYTKGMKGCSHVRKEINHIETKKHMKEVLSIEEW